MPHKQQRPTKVCPVCGRPFQWRKQWRNVWAEVRYCSERCRRRRRTQGGAATGSPGSLDAVEQGRCHGLA